MKLKKLRVGIATILIAAISTVPVFAGSIQNTANSHVPGFDASHYITSAVSISDTYVGYTQYYQVSAYYHGSNPGNASMIKTAWSISASGIAVSIGGVTGSTGGNSFSGSWTNTNAYISSYSGSYNISGFAVTGTASNTASLLVSGVPTAATASVFRF